VIKDKLIERRLNENKVRSNFFLDYKYFNYQNLNNEQGVPGLGSGADNFHVTSMV
jgi:hypothetical protein